MFTITSHVDIHDHRFTVTPPPPILDSSKTRKATVTRTKLLQIFLFHRVVRAPRWPDCPDPGVPLYRRRGLRRLRARHALGLVLYSEPPLTSQHARGRSRTRARLRLARAPGARFAKIAATAALCGTVARRRAVRPRAATLVVLDSGAVLCLGPRARTPSSWRYRERRGAPRPRGRGAF